ncbi:MULTISPECIES: papain-like cysteine protease family protein [unclassified Sphingomonas]|uniref:papain-like cysteine protease family protein n=1 Tax=unclassified Sphingomonas TaxID=196159 RepID=UPI00177E5AC4|nr:MULTISPECIES: papain-like cysteine protease family protein [unclassified Sphingomonas]MBD8700595.1 hypothetical protein [Sphingomonas sp. CFBP 13714]MBP2511753.1 hypothetical protein [Sphingomonas sp. PvP018]
MQIPAFMGAPLALRSSDRGGAPSGTEHVVPGFELVCQEQTNWCWAAVTQAVERLDHNPVEQADIATDHIARSRPDEGCDVFDPADVEERACAEASCDAHCNSPHSLTAILNERGRLRENGGLGRISFSALKAEIMAGRPVPCRIAWQTGGAHFVCVAGVSDGGAGKRFVHVYDPLFPGLAQGRADRLTMRFDTFRDGYADRTGEKVLGEQSHAYLVG